MSVVIHVPDVDGLYAAVSAGTGPKNLLRKNIQRLGWPLATAVRELGPADERVLCVVLLRGGALLYPGFAAELENVTFCMLGLRRVGDEVVTEYRSELPAHTYDRVVYVDCIAATGNTILAARTAIAQACERKDEIAAVVCSARDATTRLLASGISVIGFSLDETQSSGVVAPDFGRLDAGEVFASVAEVDAPDPASLP